VGDKCPSPLNCIEPPGHIGLLGWQGPLPLGDASWPSRRCCRQSPSMSLQGPMSHAPVLFNRLRTVELSSAPSLGREPGPNSAQEVAWLRGNPEASPERGPGLRSRSSRCSGSPQTGASADPTRPAESGRVQGVFSLARATAPHTLWVSSSVAWSQTLK
jgi:hypothetical protein